MAHDDDPCLVCGCVQAEDDLRAQVAALRAALDIAIGYVEQANEILSDEHVIDEDDVEDMGDKVAWLRETLALTDAQAGEMWAAMVRVCEAARRFRHAFRREVPESQEQGEDMERQNLLADSRDLRDALAALDGGRPGPDRSDPAE